MSRLICRSDRCRSRLIGSTSRLRIPRSRKLTISAVAKIATAYHACRGRGHGARVATISRVAGAGWEVRADITPIVFIAAVGVHLAMPASIRGVSHQASTRASSRSRQKQMLTFGGAEILPKRHHNSTISAIETAAIMVTHGKGLRRQGLIGLLVAMLRFASLISRPMRDG